MLSIALQPGEGITFTESTNDRIIARIVLRSIEFLKSGQFFLVDVQSGQNLATVRQLRINPKRAIVLPVPKDAQGGRLELCSPTIDNSGQCRVSVLVQVDDDISVEFAGLEPAKAC